MEIILKKEEVILTNFPLYMPLVGVWGQFFPTAQN
jgi:hypothetical protein